MATIEERAKAYAKGDGIENSLGGWEDMADAYIKGATEQDRIARQEQRGIDIEKAKKAFCEARCPLQYEMCQKEHWQKDCLAYFNFCKAMEGGE